MEDVTHTARDVEKLSEENESLRRRVLELEMECQRHARREAALEAERDRIV